MIIKRAKLSDSLEMKHDELRLLRGFLAQPPRMPATVRKDFGAFFQHKVLLLRELRAQSFKKHPYANTNIGKLTSDWYGFRFMHRYSRQGDALIGESICKQIYPTAPARLKAHGFFLTSGQSATHTALMALTKRLALRPESELSRIYFETRDLLDRLPPQSYVGGFEFQDSSALDFSWSGIAAPEAEKVLLFDTTCVDRQDPSLKNFLKDVHETRRPVILVRSCVKLDSFGAEYGTLGNLLILNPESFPRAQAASPFGSINEVIKATGAVLGHFTSIDSVYPFLTDVSATQLNSRRVQRIQANSRQLCAYLRAQNIDVRLKPHGLFCELPGRGVEGAPTLQKKAQKLGLLSSFPFHFADTFGLDVSTVSTYLDFYDPAKKPVLRIAPADLTAEEFAAQLDLYGLFVGR